MEQHTVVETKEVIDGTTYIVKSVMPNKDDIKKIKNKIKKLILSNLKDIEKDTNIPA